jgi:uncharacterized glyoxalase superfamily protein PhnB
MQAVIPALRITNEARSKAFYCDALGFQVDWEHRFEPGFPIFMQISRDNLTLYLTEHTGDCQVGGLVYLYVPDVDAWYAQLTQHGIQAEPPEDQPWGNREFRIADPDGNGLNICTRLPS